MVRGKGVVDGRGVVLGRVGRDGKGVDGRGGKSTDTVISATTAITAMPVVQLPSRPPDAAKGRPLL